MCGCRSEAARCGRGDQSLPLEARRRKGRVDQCDGRSGTLYITVRAWQCRRRLAERTVSGSAEKGDGSHCFKPTPCQRALKVSGRWAFAQSETVLRCLSNAYIEAESVSVHPPSDGKLSR